MCIRDSWETNTGLLTHPLLVEMVRRAHGHVRLAHATALPPWRDDLAPVEQMVHGLILHYLLGQP